MIVFQQWFCFSNNCVSYVDLNIFNGVQTFRAMYLCTERDTHTLSVTSVMYLVVSC